MRRDENKKFKVPYCWQLVMLLSLNNEQNSVFVEFTEPSGVEAFLNADLKPTFDGKELITMTKFVFIGISTSFADEEVAQRGLLRDENQGERPHWQGCRSKTGQL